MKHIPQYRIAAAATTAATFIDEYDIRKQSLIFCKYVVAAYQEADLYHHINLITFAEKVADKMKYGITLSYTITKDLTNATIERII